MKKFLLLALAMSPALAMADAPFCAVFSYGRQCYYYDLQSCRQAAAQMNGMCVPNPSQQQMATGTAPFCSVTSMGVQCMYYDVNSCYQSARMSGGTCAANPNAN